MNEQLETFRKRLRGPDAPQQTRERMKAREWVAIIVSVTALGLSALTAYFGSIRQKEELRVFVGDAIPFLSWTDDGRLQVEGDLDIALMNVGTRPLIILSVSLAVSQTEQEVPANQSCPGLSGFPFDVDSFVLKEKESVAKLLRLKSSGASAPRNAKFTEDGRMLLPPKNFRKESPRYAATCVRIVGATPSRQLLSAEIRLADFEWSADGTPKGGSRYVTGPGVFWTKQGTIFDMD